MTVSDFFIVWKDGGGTPTCKHTTFTEAKAEAARLTRLHGGRFHVMQRAATCERVDIGWDISESGRLLASKEDDDIPF